MQKVLVLVQELAEDIKALGAPSSSMAAISQQRAVSIMITEIKTMNHLKPLLLPLLASVEVVVVMAGRYL